MRRFAALIICSLVLLSSFHFSGVGGSGESSEIILRAAVQDEMRTRNILGVLDVWSSHVLWQCYDTVLKIDPKTGIILPYILEGTEINGIPGLQDNEIGIFDFMPGSTVEIAAYYNFTDVKFHDGKQVDVLDIIFSYHILALHPRWYGEMASLMDDGGSTGNHSSNRWLWIWYEDDGDGNPLTSLIRFHLENPYYGFWLNTMNIPILPRHIWEGTGGGIHEDFGYVVDSKGYGVGLNHPELEEFDLMGVNGAIEWEPADDEVIGTGMFKFKEFIAGQHAKVITNEDYLEVETGGRSVHVPFIDGIEFIKFSTPQQATMGLKKGEADIILWSVPPDFLPELQSDPNVEIASHQKPGFYYVAFNMQTSRFGYPYNDPQQGDWGKPLREAIAHLIDKKTLVDYYLQGYGLVADGPVSPTEEFWYNSSLPKYEFNAELAKSKLDAAGFIDIDGDGWRDTDIYSAGDQDDRLTLMAPNPDYDPIRAQPCLLTESHMKEAGINVFCSHQSFGTVTDALERRDFDMVQSGWHLEDLDPTAYLHSLFYSNSSLNYPSYKSNLFDQVILESMQETNLTKRQALVKWAQGIVVEDLPIIFLNFKKNIEAYRHDRFVGWIAYKGSIFNYWSLMNIRPPSDKYLRAVITIASAVQSNKTLAFTVTVRDQDRNLVQSATVNITVEMGNLTVGGIDYGQSWEGTSNVNGQVSTNFKAPYVRPTNETMGNGTKVSITVKATKIGYDDSAIKSVFITVFPSNVKFLSVTIELKHGDIIEEYKATEIDIMIKDENLKIVDGATVRLTSLPSNLNINPNYGTTSNGGRFEKIIVRAPGVEDDTIYVIYVKPSKSDYKGVDGTVELTVLNQKVIPPPPLPPYFLIVLVLVIVIATIVFFNELRKLKRQPKE